MLISQKYKNRLGVQRVKESKLHHVYMYIVRGACVYDVYKSLSLPFSLYPDVYIVRVHRMCVWYTYISYYKVQGT